MSELVRFGVSLERPLLERFDELIRERQYTNRSEALRDMIRSELVQRAWREGRDVAGAITLIYDHHKRDLLHRIMDLQHDYQKIIISTQHIHLDHDNCLEIVAVKGIARDVLELANTLKEGVEGITAVVFDGIVTQRILDIAAEQKIGTIIGTKMGNITKQPTGTDVWSKDDLN